MVRLIGIFLGVGVLSSCAEIGSAEARAIRDQAIGTWESEALRFEAPGGLLHVREATDEQLVLRASAAEFRFELIRKSPSLEAVTVRIWNIPPGITLRTAPQGTADPGEDDPALHLGRRWTLRFPEGVDRVQVESDGLPQGDFTFLAFGDIQTGISRFGDIIAAVNTEPDADFILMLGDLTQTSTQAQFDRVEDAYGQIRFPIYATPGNHDVNEPGAYQDRFGRANYSLTHRGARFTSFDSASAAMAPSAFAGFTESTEAGRDQFHVVFSHVPALETLGLRSAQWNSRREAHRFISRAAATKVDLLFFGHIHTHDAYELGGVPTYISGGCGAIEEQFDDIDRHYLRVRVHAETGTATVEVIQVDP